MPEQPAIQSAYEGIDFYCDVAIPNASQLHIVYEDDRTIAFHHTKPFWAVHIVVVPKKHIPSLTNLGDGTEEDVRSLFAAVQAVAKEIERQSGAAAVTTNLGDYQDSKHLHIHVHSGITTSKSNCLQVVEPDRHSSL